MPTQAERRASTRRALLAAAADTLVARGATGFTTAAVADAAGVSNGALFRHFPTRLDLVAATVEHVLAELRDGYAARFAATGPRTTTPADLLQLLWECMADPRLAAVYELYAQCRTDIELFTAIQPVVDAHVRAVGESATEVLESLAAPLPHDAREQVALAILAMQGLIVNNLAGASVGSERALIDVLADCFEHSTRGAR